MCQCFISSSLDLKSSLKQPNESFYQGRLMPKMNLNSPFNCYKNRTSSNLLVHLRHLTRAASLFLLNFLMSSWFKQTASLICDKFQRIISSLQNLLLLISVHFILSFYDCDSKPSCRLDLSRQEHHFSAVSPKSFITRTKLKHYTSSLITRP